MISYPWVPKSTEDKITKYVMNQSDILPHPRLFREYIDRAGYILMFEMWLRQRFNNYNMRYPHGRYTRNFDEYREYAFMKEFPEILTYMYAPGVLFKDDIERLRPRPSLRKRRRF
jgi:hypothetical protein